MSRQAGLRALRALGVTLACGAAALAGLALGPGCACDNTHWALTPGSFAVEGWYALEDAPESEALTGTLEVGERGDTVVLTYEREDGRAWRVELAED